MGWGKHCKENPELSPKAVTAGIHYPSGDVLMASVSHCQALGWEQPMAWAASNLDGVRAAHPAPHNGSSQAAHTPPRATTQQPWTLQQTQCYFEPHQGTCFLQDAPFLTREAMPGHCPSLPSHQPWQCPSVPMPALSRGYHQLSSPLC